MAWWRPKGIPADVDTVTRCVSSDVSSTLTENKPEGETLMAGNAAGADGCRINSTTSALMSEGDVVTNEIDSLDHRQAGTTSALTVNVIASVGAPPNCSTMRCDIGPI